MTESKTEPASAEALLSPAEVVIGLIAMQVSAEKAGMVATAARLSALHKLAAAEFDMMRAASGDLLSGASVTVVGPSCPDQQSPSRPRQRYLC